MAVELNTEKATDTGSKGPAGQRGGKGGQPFEPSKKPSPGPSAGPSPIQSPSPKPGPSSGIFSGNPLRLVVLVLVLTLPYIAFNALAWWQVVDRTVTLSAVETRNMPVNWRPAADEMILVLDQLDDNWQPTAFLPVQKRDEKPSVDRKSGSVGDKTAAAANTAANIQQKTPAPEPTSDWFRRNLSPLIRDGRLAEIVQVIDQQKSTEIPPATFKPAEHLTYPGAAYLMRGPGSPASGYLIGDLSRNLDYDAIGSRSEVDLSTVLTAMVKADDLGMKKLSILVPGNVVPYYQDRLALLWQSMIDDR